MDLSHSIMRSGTRFCPNQPKVSDVHISDIAHALSNLCRWGGHSRFFYSVAEHSVRASYLSEVEHRFAVLMHDASEAYCIDLPRPIKYLAALAPYRALENRVQRVIGERFGIDWKQSKEAIHQADTAMMMVEDDDLMFGRVFGADENQPIEAEIARRYLVAGRIIPWTPEQARHQFLRRFNELAPAGV